MSEQLVTPEQALAADIRHLIAGPMAEVEQEVNNSGLRPIVEAAFTYNPLMQGTSLVEVEMQRALVSGEVDDPSYKYNRAELTYFVTQVTGNMAVRLMDVYPSLEGQDENNMTHMVKPFRQGHEKLHRVMVTDNPYVRDFPAASYLTPIMLAILAGYTADYQAAEDMEVAQRRLQVAAEHIMDGGSLAVRKNMQPEDEVFARTMNMLGMLYHRGSDVDFYTRFIQHDYDVHLHADPELRINPANISADDLRRIRRGVSGRVRSDNELFGITADVDAVIDKYLAGTIRQKAPKPIDGDFEAFRKAGNRANDRRHAATAKQTARLSAKREDFIIESQRVLVARSMVHLMAEGAFDYQSSIRFSELMASQPLKDIARDVAVPEQLVEWEIAPPAVGEGESHGPCARSEEKGIGAGWDMARKEMMDEYVRMWGAEIGPSVGQGRTVRSRIPNLKESEQYYLAILPQKVGDIVLEHAIGDNPALGRHAVYVWRAEAGVGRFGQVQQNWETVFSQKKKVMKQLGARRMLHGPTLEGKVLEYITRPSDALGDPKYYY